MQLSAKNFITVLFSFASILQFLYSFRNVSDLNYRNLPFLNTSPMILDGFVVIETGAGPKEYRLRKDPKKIVSKLIGTPFTV